jgi:ATP-dependent protease HslVU (ClpYQ) peptidase subunit
MTCIVGIAIAGEALIGADRMTTAGQVTKQNSTKIARRGDILIGISGDHRVADLIFHTWEPPAEYRLNSAGSIVRNVVPVWRELLKAGGSLEIKEGVEGMRSDAMLVTAVGVFIIHCDFCVTPGHDGYHACGSGLEVALGALHATADLRPRTRIEKALAAAAAHNVYVGDVFDILSLT